MWVIFWLMETISFLFSGIGELLPVEVVYFLTKAYFSVNPSYRSVETSFFVYWKHYFFILRFFLLVETIIGIRRKLIFKDEPYSCQWTPIFFNFFRYFLKWKQFLCIFQQILFPTRRNRFSVQWKQFFLSELFFCEWKTLLELGANQFSRKKNLFSLVDSCQFFTPFFRDPCQYLFSFRLVKTSFPMKSFISATGSGFQG